VSSQNGSAPAVVSASSCEGDGGTCKDVALHGASRSKGSSSACSPVDVVGIGSSG